MLIAEVASMPMTEKKIASNKKWNDKNMNTRYDHVHLVLTPKGRKEELQALASSSGESLNGYINRIIDEAIKKAPDSR